MGKLTPEEKERRKQERRQKKYNETHKIIDGIVHKICKTCKEWYPYTPEFFYISKTNGINGPHPNCKKCDINKTITLQTNLLMAQV